MNRPVYDQLAPVRRRQQWLFVLRLTVLGLLASSIAGLILSIILRQQSGVVPPEWIAGVLFSGPVLGGLVGIIWRRCWHDAAASVDTHYELKDRAITALTFVDKPARTALQDLQVDDAVERLSALEPHKVVPVVWPRFTPVALGSLAFALLITFWPTESSVVEAGTLEPLAAVLAEAERLQEDILEMEDIAKKQENKELQELVDELKQKVEELKQPGVDVKEALAKLSEMQAAIQAQQAQYNVGLVDAQLQAMGEAMTAAQALEGAGKAMVEAKYEKAAEELEKLENPELDRKEAKAVEEKLRKAAQEAGECGLGSLCEAATEMADGIKGGNGSRITGGGKKMAKAVAKHGRLKKINNLLSGELDRLSEAKCNCQANSTAKGKKPQKSVSPSESWGMGESGNTQGEKTSLLSQKNLEQLTGNPDEGPSEVETTRSAEGRQQAGRGYREVYQKYRRMSETVLDSEPIPLGHRQLIRKYFELIRPQQADGEKEPAGGAK